MYRVLRRDFVDPGTTCVRHRCARSITRGWGIIVRSGDVEGPIGPTCLRNEIAEGGVVNPFQRVPNLCSGIVLEPRATRGPDSREGADAGRPGPERGEADDEVSSCEAQRDVTAWASDYLTLVVDKFADESIAREHELK